MPSAGIEGRQQARQGLHNGERGEGREREGRHGRAKVGRGGAGAAGRPRSFAGMEMPTYLPITSDYGFKVTFGNQRDTLFLRRALQALIQSETPIREVTFEPTAFEGLTAERRGGVLDLSCVDERGRHFIVEMQVAYAPQFLQRLKFYALHKLESLVRRGPFSWATLPPIYCVALLSRSILPGPDYHTVANLRKASGELIDDQLTFVLVELDKFELPLAAPPTDLDKLIFTMQNVNEEPRELASEPDFWQEPWLRQALDQLSIRNMTRAQYDEYLFLQMQRMDELTAEEERQKTIAAREQAQAETQQAQAEREQAQAETQQAQAERDMAENRLKTTVRNLLRSGRFTVEEVAELSGSTLEQVQRWQAEA